MPVSSRRNIPKMTESLQYFEVGEVFAYVPLDEPTNEILVEVVDSRSLGGNRIYESCSYCDLRTYCSGTGYKPACWRSRKDGIGVYFKMI